MDSVTVFSIGHSDHATEDFIDLLRRHGVRTVADVRSQPYSRWVSQYNRDILAHDLEMAGLRYVYLGDSLGGRPADPALYPAGQEQPDYDRAAATSEFLAGLDRLVALARSSTTAMMCSEGDHQKCHRTLLITPELLARQVRVVHILPDGRTVEADPPAKQLTLF